MTFIMDMKILMKRKLKLDIFLIFFIAWAAILLAFLFNFDFIAYYLGYFLVYLYLNEWTEKLESIIYIRFIVLVLIFSAFYLFRYFRHVFKYATEDDDIATVANLKGKFLWTTYFSCPTMTQEQKESLNCFSEKEVVQQQLLGKGNFGEVYQGMLCPVGVQKKYEIALKAYKTGTIDDLNAFLQEANLMSCFDHENIIRYVGISEMPDTSFLIMELMPGGDLLHFLRANRSKCGTEEALAYADILPIIIDVASGCRYLEKRKIIHRDLACRNCLLTSDDLSKCRVKLSDFGMTRKLYRNDSYKLDPKKQPMLPFRWMAPESLQSGIFTSKTDVWTFGVLCWEVITLGEEPYKNKGTYDVVEYIRNGGKLKKPGSCPADFFKHINNCWNLNNQNRPTFFECTERFKMMLDELEDWASSPLECPPEKSEPLNWKEKYAILKFGKDK